MANVSKEENLPLDNVLPSVISKEVAKAEDTRGYFCE